MSAAAAWRRHRGAAVAFLIAAAVVAFQHRRLGDPHVRHTRFELPAFDAYVYVAMAEHPGVFTVAPWGHRILTPWIVHALPVRNVIRGFRCVTWASLVLAGVLLFLFLRRLGHGEWASLAAVAAFSLSGPVAEALRAPFLGEPLSAALFVAFLLAVESGAGLAVLALLAVLGAFSKEIYLLLVPFVYLTRRERVGRGRALAAASLVALPALAVTLTLRLWWTAGLETPRPALGLDLLRAGIEVLRETWGETWPALLLGGVTPLALAGALRKEARPFLRRYGYLLAATFVLALVAWVNVPSPRPVPLFGTNVLRLLLYALPFLLVLGLLAVDRVWPHRGPPPSPAAPRPPVQYLAAAGVAACLAFPFLALDRYRRVGLHEPRDGPLALAVCRESLRTASRLERGQTVSFNPERHRFVWGISDPGQLDRMRWFLREGWGPLPHYGTGDMVMRAERASVLVPCLRPRDLEVTLATEAPTEARLAAFLNGHPVGEVAAGPAPGESALRLPASVLFRGDNLLTLASSGGAPLVRLREIRLRAVGP